jgi:hypothetical protein
MATLRDIVELNWLSFCDVAYSRYDVTSNNSIDRYLTFVAIVPIKLVLLRINPLKFSGYNMYHLL